MSSVAVPVSSSLPRPSAAELRQLVEAELADRISGALSPHERVAPEMTSSGITALDELAGGWPRGTLSELFGPASSGRTSVLVAALAAATARGEACALVDAGDSFDPESAAAAGADLKKLLWVRCGRNSAKQNSPRRHEGTKADRVIGESGNRAIGTATAQFGNSAIRQPGNSFVSSCLRGESIPTPEPRDIGIWGYGDTETMERINPALARKNHSPQRHEGTKNSGVVITSARSVRGICFSKADASEIASPRHDKNGKNFVSSCLRGEDLLRRGKYRAAYARIEQALKAADLLLGAGGFGLVIIDLAGLPPEAARRVPLTTWFRFRRAVEATSTVLLVVSPQAITQSCAALALKMQPSDVRYQLSAGAKLPVAGCQLPDVCPSHGQLLTGFRLRAEVVRSPLPGRIRPHSTHAEIVTQAKWA